MREHTLPDNFPHKYFFFGSENSTDEDVIIIVDSIPENQETSIQYLKSLQRDYNVDWNMNMVIIKDGMIIDSIPSKGSPDSIAYSLKDTYNFHQQKYEYPITKYMDRHFLLHIYKCVRTVLSTCTRTQYRKEIKPFTKGCHAFSLKREAMTHLRFQTIETFNNKYQDDASSWKVICFYLVQSFHYITTGEYFTDKDSIVKEYPFTHNFIYRKELTRKDKTILNDMRMVYLTILNKYNFVDVEPYILELDNEKIHMGKEKAIYELQE